MPRIGGPRGPQGAPEHAKNFKGNEKFRQGN